MPQKSVYVILTLCSLLALLVGCQGSPQATEPPPTATTIPPSSTPAPSNTPEPTATIVPSATPIPPTATITLSPEEPVTALDELVGTWVGRWSDINAINLEFLNTQRAIVSFARNNSVLVRLIFTIENGIITWTSSEGPSVASACSENPVATYEVYITRRGDQPVSLYFVLVGEDACIDRVELLDGNTLKWVEP